MKCMIRTNYDDKLLIFSDSMTIISTGEDDVAKAKRNLLSGLKQSLKDLDV